MLTWFFLTKSPSNERQRISIPCSHILLYHGDLLLMLEEKIKDPMVVIQPMAFLTDTQDFERIHFGSTMPTLFHKELEQVLVSHKN